MQSYEKSCVVFGFMVMLSVSKGSGRCYKGGYLEHKLTYMKRHYRICKRSSYAALLRNETHEIQFAATIVLFRVPGILV